MDITKIQTKICKNPDCPHAGEEQPISNFRTSNHGTTYRTECRDCEKAYKRKIKEADPEKFKKQKQKWDKTYRDKHHEEKLRKDREYYWNNLDKQKEYRDTHRLQRRAAVNQGSAARRAREKAQTPPDANYEEIRHFYDLAQQLTESTGIPHEVDHIMPLSKGGLHHQNNLQILTTDENRKKRDKTPEEWEAYKAWEKEFKEKIKNEK